MSCEDDLDLVGKQLGLTIAAEGAMDAAWGNLEQERADFNEALADWVGADDKGWADAAEAAEAAWGDLGSAKGDFDKAEEAFNEEKGWLDFAQDEYCDCKRHDEGAVEKGPP